MKILESVYKLSNVTRFVGKRMDMNYNVAEHSYRVAQIAMIICDDYNSRSDKKIDTLEVLKKALLHDLEESLLGDIPTPLKKIGNLREELRKAGKIALETEILDKELVNRDEYLKLWIEDKDNETGEVIVLADTLDILITSHKEFERGNTPFKKIKDRSIDKLEELPYFSKYPILQTIIESYK